MVKQPAVVHLRAVLCITNVLRKNISTGLALPIRQTSIVKAEETSVTPKKESAPGLGKLRYLGGWCVATLQYRKKQVVRRNRYSESAGPRAERVDVEVQLLEQLVTTEADLNKTSWDKDTLYETSRKQNLRNGLTNITDGAFGFFKDLDREIRQLETVPNLHIHGPSFYAHVHEQLLKNKTLQSAWMGLFTCEDILEQDDVATAAAIQTVFNRGMCGKVHSYEQRPVPKGVPASTENPERRSPSKTDSNEDI